MINKILKERQEILQKLTNCKSNSRRWKYLEKRLTKLDKEISEEKIIYINKV